MFFQRFNCPGNNCGGGNFFNCGNGNGSRCGEFDRQCCEPAHDCECQPKKLSGAKFVLCSECGKEIACGVTNNCGEILFECLPIGKYYLKELEAPCGYCKCDDVVEVCVTCEKCNRVVEFTNVKKTGSIKVIKIGK